jgi:hypothetical protein
VSRFIELLRKSGQSAAPAMGFRAARSAGPPARLRLVAALEPGKIDSPKDYLEGAHAALLRSEAAPDAQAIRELAAALPDIPWGAYLGSKKSAAAMVKAGADFIVLPAAGPVAAATTDDETGTILEVDASLADGWLRAAGDLPVDAVLAAGINLGDKLTWEDIIGVQRLANLLTKPLLVPLNAAIGEAGLKAVWEAGADGVVAAVDAARADAIKELRRLIDKLPPRTARPRGRNEAILPRTGGPSEPPPDEEEEEYE